MIGKVSFEEVAATKRPPEWDVVLEATTAVFDPDAPHDQQYEAAERAVITAQTLLADDPNCFEEARYYGLRLVICKFMGKLWQPEEEEQFVQTAVERIRQYHELWTFLGYAPTRGLRLRDIGSDGSPALVPDDYARAEYGTISPQQRIAINALAAVEATDDTGYAHEIVLRDTFAQVTVVDTSLSSVNIVRAMLMMQHEQNVGPLSLDKMLATPVEAIATPQQIAKLDLAADANVLARFRVDESANPRGLLVSKHGRIRANRALLRQPPPEVGIMPAAASRIVRHEQRIGCPALRIPHAVRYMAGLATTIVSRAQAELLEA